MQFEWEYEAELALRAASIGGEILLERPEKINAHAKESFRDIVTDFDQRVERVVLDILKEKQYSVLAEESFSNGNPGFTSKSDVYWAVDPLDGTANFVSGMPIYGVSIGLVEKNISSKSFLVGAISLPSAKELYFTHGKYSYLNGKRLNASDSGMQDALIVASFSGQKGDPNFRRKQYEMFGLVNDSSRGCLRLGSAAAAISYVASGRIQAAYGFDAQIWDVAAGLAIAHHAGFKIWISHKGQSTRMDYIVGAPTVVDEILKLGKSLEVISL